MIQLVGSRMFKGPTHWKSAINIVPEGSDLSPVRIQNPVNNPSEGVYGILIALRVEVMLGEEQYCWMTPSGPGRICTRSLRRPNREECDACVQVEINTHKSVTVETPLSGHRCAEGVLVDCVCGMSRHGTAVAKKLLWSQAALLDREHVCRLWFVFGPLYVT